MAPRTPKPPRTDTDGVYLIREIKQSGRDDMYKIPFELIQEVSRVIGRRRTVLDSEFHRYRDAQGWVDINDPTVLALRMEETQLSYLLTSLVASMDFNPGSVLVYDFAYERLKTLQKRQRLLEYVQNQATSEATDPQQRKE